MIVRPKINRNNQINTIEQIIVEVHPFYVKVVSRKGKKYEVNLSDKIRLNRKVEVGDVAVIKTFPNGWLVTDIRKKQKEPILSDEEEKKETEKQIKEIEEIYWW